LQDFTLKIVRKQVQVTQEDLDTFYEAGYGERQVLEVILGLSQKVISNWTNHIANTSVEVRFVKYAWNQKQFNQIEKDIIKFY
jgi:hypothetical protein